MITTSPRAQVRNHDMTAAWRHVDVVLCALVGMTATIGSLMIYSATRNKEASIPFIEKHIIFVTVGIAAMVICATIDYVKLRDWARLLYVLGIISLVGVLSPIGSEHKGIKAWYDIGPFQIQPAEVAKVLVIVAVASYLGTSVTKLGARHLVVSLLMFGVPMGLIMLQPDLGTNLVFVMIAAGMLAVAGIPMRYLVALGVVAVIGVVGILQSDTLDKYQRDRLTTVFRSEQADSAAVYNTKQSQTAISLGGLTGKGYLEGAYTAGGSVPEQQTDFIFTVPGEELGFLGSSVLLLLLGGIVWRVWRTAQLARDEVGRLICVGILCLLVFHIFENVGMNLGIMPVTGIPLPFVSYGGSATISAFACMGLVLNVHMRRFS
ncbi:MAG TPA: rod shape-determining protein RodA [Microthrixaceae bacterium]|jgi:rod shape determining protein RodA|nr:rod shape-determining protein RodA [Microthrixaceae bacterium]